MINVLSLCLFGAMFLGMFSVGFQFTSVNRIFVSTPKEVFERSIRINEEDEHIVYFDDDSLLKNLNSYYQENISFYVTRFEITTDYYNFNDEFCFLDNCTKVKVNFRASLAFSLTYQKSMFYEIVRTQNG